MIDAVEKLLLKEVNDSARTFITRDFEHDLTIRREVQHWIIKGEVDLCIQEWMDWASTQKVTQQITLGNAWSSLTVGGLRTTKTVWEPDEITRAVNKGLDDFLCNAKWWRQKARSIRGGSTWKSDKVEMKQMGTDVHIHLPIGVIGQKGTDTAHQQNIRRIVNIILTDGYRLSRARAFDHLEFPYSQNATIVVDPSGEAQRATGAAQRGSPKSKKTGKYGQQGPGRSAGTLTKTGSKRKRENILVGHGDFTSVDEGQIVNVGEEQTTVAVLGLASKWEAIKKKQSSFVPKKWGEGMVNSIVTSSFKHRLGLHLSLKKFTGNKGGLNDKLEIDIGALDYEGNQSPNLQKYDVGGIKEHIRTKAKKWKNSWVTKIAQNVVDMEGSPSIKERQNRQVQKQYIEALLKIKGTRPDFRLKVNKKLLGKAKQTLKNKKEKGSVTSKNIGKASISGGAAFRAAKSKTPQMGRGKSKRGVRSVNAAKTKQSPIALRNLINEMLPEMVASKMTQPALQFRTGRFANSARVEHLAIGSRGGVHIDYTYMRNPYETFEPGGKQGSTNRDPRKIIGASIRELAMGIIGRQPTSIRRN